MKFYITEKTKKELEAEIEKLGNHAAIDEFDSNTAFSERQTLKKILSKSHIITDEEPYLENAKLLQVCKESLECIKDTTDTGSSIYVRKLLLDIIKSNH